MMTFVLVVFDDGTTRKVATRKLIDVNSRTNPNKYEIFSRAHSVTRTHIGASRRAVGSGKEE